MAVLVVKSPRGGDGADAEGREFIGGGVGSDAALLCGLSDQVAYERVQVLMCVSDVISAMQKFGEFGGGRLWEISAYASSTARNAAAAVPMAVLVHGLPLEEIPPQLAELYEPMWQEMQREVTALVPGASYQVVPDTSHDIHDDRPDVVANTIIEVVIAARDKQD